MAIENKSEPRLLYLSRWMEKFPELELTAGFTTRLGGLSDEEFDSLNCGLHVFDHDNKVIANRQLIADAVQIPLSKWTYGEQTHSDKVHIVTELDYGKGIVSRTDALQATDAFVTQSRNGCLAALFADCVPLYFIDPIHQAVGLAHAGWKGSVLQIAKATVETMQEAYGSQPKEMFAAIGPSIGDCCYEVDGLVMDQVQALSDKLGLEPSIRSSIASVQNNGKYKLSLQQLNRQIMIKAGILPSSIEVTEQCTSCNTDLFYSHRKENGKTGRMIAWIGMRCS